MSQGAHISTETMLDRRLHMVNSQLRTGGIVDKALLAAYLATPRQRFVAPEVESLAYLDRELPARGGAKRKLMAPSTQSGLGLDIGRITIPFCQPHSSVCLGSCWPFSFLSPPFDCTGLDSQIAA